MGDYIPLRGAVQHDVTVDGRKRMRKTTAVAVDAESGHYLTAEGRWVRGLFIPEPAHVPAAPGWYVLYRGDGWESRTPVVAWETEREGGDLGQALVLTGLDYGDRLNAVERADDMIHEGELIGYFHPEHYPESECASLTEERKNKAA